MLCVPLMNALVQLLRMHTITVRERARTEMILALHGFPAGLTQAAVNLGRDVKTVRVWYRRAASYNACFPERLEQALKEPGHAGAETRTVRLARDLLQDAPRSGRPPTYSPRHYVNIVTVALTEPRESGRPITHWTARELTDEVHERGICAISERQVGRFLHEIDLQPHKFTRAQGAELAALSDWTPAFLEASEAERAR